MHINTSRSCVMMLVAATLLGACSIDSWGVPPKSQTPDKRTNDATSDDLISSEGDRSNLDLSNLADLDWRPVSLSSKKFLKFGKGLAISPLLGTAQTPEQRPHYDAIKQEGLLSFGYSTQWVGENGDRSGTGVSSFYCDENRYLFTKIDQSDVRIGRETDNNQAKIYLKTGEAAIEVGEYPAFDPQADTGQIYEDWNHPILCEGPYADVCTLSLAVIGSGNKLGKDLKAALSLQLKGDEQPIRILSATLQHSKPVAFTHFGCE